MSDDQEKFTDEKIGVMIREMQRPIRADSEYYTQKAIEWIEKNAANFRMKWDREKGKIVGQTGRAS